MRAAIAGRYGPPETIHVTEVPDPVPGAGEALVRVHAAAITAGDARIRAGRFPQGFGTVARVGIGLRGPRRPVLGVVFSGVIEHLGSTREGTARFAVGDEVTGMTGARMGAHAELVAVATKRITPKPAGLSHADAAATLFGGTTALHFLRDRAALGEGQRVLVNGASGSVGSAAVQLAHDMGAVVTGVCSEANRALVASLGAKETIDYAKQPVSILRSSYDLVFDAVGNITRQRGLELITPNGGLVLAVAGLADTVRAGGRVYAGAAPEHPSDFATLLAMTQSGGFTPLTRVLGGLVTIREAHAIVDSGHKVGNLIVLPQEV